MWFNHIDIASKVVLIYTVIKPSLALFFVDNNKEQNLNRDIQPPKGGVDWRTGIEIFTRVSTWVVVPIVLALVVGKILDKHYGTGNLIFLLLTGVAFLFSTFGIVRVVSKYMKDISK